MLDDRTRVAIQVWVVADKYNIQQNTVHSIISSYLSYCKELLAAGERVDFFGLVSIVPDYLAGGYTPTLAHNCGVVGQRIGVPSHTVYRVMEAYITDAIAALKKGTTVEIRGLVTCVPLFEGGVVTKVHSKVSQTLKNIFVGTKVTSVRVHTYKCLRDELRG